jgi:sugar lactone lactonase YvrE
MIEDFSSLPLVEMPNDEMPLEKNTMTTPFYTSSVFTPPGGFTAGIEGPAVDTDGNLYAVNFAREGTIGRVTPQGECSVFVELPPGSTGNGIRFDSQGRMLVADYTGHNILTVDMLTRKSGVLAHEARMHQPNDITISSGDIVFASDPDWKTGTGRMWRIDPQGRITLLETGMGTTNGIEVGPDESILYVNESVQRRIWAYDLSPHGEVSNKHLLIEFPDFGLDGMRCDVEGCLYVTRYGKGTIAKLSPRGEVLHEIGLAGEKPSNLAFGGPDGRRVYATLADRGNVETFEVDSPGREWALSHKR